MTRRTIVSALLSAAVAVAAAEAPSAAVRAQDYQPTSIAFLDRQHGVLAEEGWACDKTSCPAEILVSSDSGETWHLTLRSTSPVRVFPVRGTSTVWAGTGASVIRSDDGGRTWRRVLDHPAALAFADPTTGLGFASGASPSSTATPLLATKDGGKSWQRLKLPCRDEWAFAESLSLPTPRRGWLVCVSQAGAGSEGKEVWATEDGGKTWTIRARTRFAPAPTEHLPNLGNLPLFGYPDGISFLADGHGWLWERRGWLLATEDGGRHWMKSPITQIDTLAAQSATRLSDNLGYALLRGCRVRLVRTTDGGQSWTTVKRWRSPSRC